jgi:hypothetical protein
LGFQAPEYLLPAEGHPFDTPRAIYTHCLSDHHIKSIATFFSSNG